MSEVPLYAVDRECAGADACRWERGRGGVRRAHPDRARPWSPFLLRRAHPGPGPRRGERVLIEMHDLLPEGQGQNLALTVAHVLHALKSGIGICRESGRLPFLGWS